MDLVFKYASGFLAGMLGLMMSIIPVAILFQVLTGTSTFGFDIIGNLTNLINQLGNSGFVGLIVLVIVTSFFVKK